MAVDPTGQSREQNLPGLEDVGHERIVIECDWRSQLLPALRNR